MIILRKPYKPSSDLTFRSGVIVADTVSGTQNGSNQTFNTTYEYKRDRIDLHLNGQALHAPYDFIQTGPNEIELIHIYPLPDDNLRATYEIEGNDYSQGLSGRQAVALGAVSQQVNFGYIFPDTSYFLDVELITSDNSPCVYSFVVGNKTTSGFTVFFSGEVDTNNYTLEWEAKN